MKTDREIQESVEVLTKWKEQLEERETYLESQKKNAEKELREAKIKWDLINRLDDAHLRNEFFSDNYIVPAMEEKKKWNDYLNNFPEEEFNSISVLLSKINERIKLYQG